MSLNHFKDNDCVLRSAKHTACIEFVLGENERHGFHSSQLLYCIRCTRYLLADSD